MSEISYDGPEAASSVELSIAHNTAAAWLLRNGEEIIHNPDSMLYFRGIPIAPERSQYAVTFSGSLVADLAPEAARQLCIEPSDDVSLRYYPAMYGVSYGAKLPPELTEEVMYEQTEFVLPDLQLVVDNGKGTAEFSISVEDLASSTCSAETIDTRFSGMTYANDGLTHDEVEGIQQLFDRLDDMQLDNKSRQLLKESVADIGDLGWNGF